MFRKKDPAIHIGGFVEPGFEDVEKAFTRNLEKGHENGAMFAVYYKDELVVDLWGGYMDKERTQPWQTDTLSLIMSVTKGVCAICLAVLADRGFLDYEKPVATYWPEFAQNGKQSITVETLLSHQAGLIGDKGGSALNLQQSQNSEVIAEFLAKQKPRWRPGKTFGYHILTMGWIMDQLIRRVDPKHRSAGRFFREEIAKPFDIDLYIGLPSDQEHRVAYTTRCIRKPLKAVISGRFWKLFPHVMNPRSHFQRSISVGTKFLPDTETVNSTYYRQLELPMCNGIGSAKSLAKLHNILANRGLDTQTGQRLLSEKMCDRLKEPLCEGLDHIFRIRRGFSRGLLSHKEYGNYVCGHFGYGGIAAYADMERNLSWAYVPNTLVMYGSREDDPRGEALKNATYECILKLEASDENLL